jgi:hypothetical protein
MVGFSCAHLGEIQPVWKNFGQLERYSTKIGGGNSTARVRPFLNEFRPKKITVLENSGNSEHILWFLTIYRASKKVQNDYLSSV